MNENGNTIKSILELNHIDDPFGVALYLVQMAQELDRRNRELERRLSQMGERITQLERQLSQDG